MKRVLSLLDRLLEAALAAALAAMVLTVGANVFLRYVIGSALSWGDEVPQILLVWITFLGAALAIRRGEQFELDLLVESLPTAVARPLRMATQLLVVLMTTAVIYWSSEVALRIVPWVMPATGISRALVYAACPVGCSFILVYTLYDLAVLIRSPGKDAGQKRSADLTT